MRFIARALLGVRAVQVARERENLAGGSGQAPKSAAKAAPLRGLLFNGLIVGGSCWAGHWVFALAWCGGLAGVFPFFNAVRQVLEHRDELADDQVNYAEAAHGRINRLFGDSLLAQTLGGAGFNRHLLHHWEPQVSCTRLAEMESFLMRTPQAALFARRRTTYSRTFRQLFKFTA